MLLKLVELKKSFYLKDGKVSRTVLDGLGLEIEHGESLAIIGPSGSGKTTLLNLIAQLDQQDEGQIEFEGQNLSELNAKGLDQYRNQSIGIVFQLHHLLPQLSLLENVLLPSLASKTDASEILKRAEKLLKKVGVWEQRHQRPAELSGGECQRAAVVRALINEPKLILADEPTGALDEENAVNLADLLIEIHHELKTALIMVTHSPELAGRMNRQFILKKGRLEESLKA